MKEIIAIKIEVLKDTNLVIIKYLGGECETIKIKKEQIELLIKELKQ